MFSTSLPGSFFSTFRVFHVDCSHSCTSCIPEKSFGHYLKIFKIFMCCISKINSVNIHVTSRVMHNLLYC